MLQIFTVFITGRIGGPVSFVRLYLTVLCIDISSGTEDDLEYYVRECGDILGVCSKLPSDCRDAKHILDYIFHQVVEFKKLNQVSKRLKW